MNKYNMTFAVGLSDYTWFQREVTVWSEDEGDARAIEMGEAQLRNSYDRSNFAVSFITLLHIEVEEDEKDAYEEDELNWTRLGDDGFEEHLD